MPTRTYTATLTIIECHKCHMDYGVTPAFNRACRDDHRTFYCPAGHPAYYPGNSEKEQLEADLARARRQIDWAETSRTAAWDQARTAEYQRRAAKGQLTKIRKRIANGVCPCCNRSFTPLAEHMRTEHPDFVPPVDES